MHQVHTLNPGCAPTTRALRPGLCACSACCVPAQPSMCHNIADPTMCLLSLLCATIQPSLLCACSAFYMPQYSRAYCVPAQPSICHNTAEPTMCLLSLLYACSGCCVPAQAAMCLLRLLYACSAVAPLVTIHCSVLRHKSLAARSSCHDTISCIVTQAQPTVNWSQYNSLYCDIASPSQASPYCNTPHPCCNIIEPTHTQLPYVAIQFPATITPKTRCVTIQFPIVL